MTRIARLDDRAVIRVTGPDARSFLHNLLTQDVEGLGHGELSFGALLSPPGRLLADLFLWGEGDSVSLDVAVDRRDDLIRRLTMYRLRARVEIAPDDRAVLAAWDGDAPGFFADPRLSGLGLRGLGEAAGTATAADWRRHELEQGLPGAPDSPADADYPIEANFDLLNGVDFRKGCFVGQETTSRMKRRGTIKNRMLTLAFDGPPPAFGAEVLLDGERRAGEARNGVDGLAMALMRLDRLDGALTVEGRPVTVWRPEWIG